MQSRLHSFVEALTNIAIGFVVSLVSQMLIFPMYGIHIPLAQDVQIVTYFTGISIVRSYALRRWFNNKVGRVE